MIELIFYSRPNCRKCEQMRYIVSSILKGDMLLREVDVSSDEILNEKYGKDVPLLVYGKQRLAQNRVNRHDLEKKLSKLGGWQ